MDLEIITVPSDKSQAQKDKYHVTSPICETKKACLVDVENETELLRECGEGRAEDG